MEILATVSQAVACIYILALGLIVLNRMDGKTRHIMRAAYVCFTAGALAGFLAAFRNPDPFVTLLAVGVALFLHGNQRETTYHAAAKHQP